ncbi:MAG: dipicolinate synthase subunit DpsA [Clostridia bacterium]|nr:dipicolinate synthase subunit DpsA [Clostridia bacterium]
MNTNFAIIGGDLRMIKLAKLLAKDDRRVYLYGLENHAEELETIKNIIFCNTLNQALQDAKIIIGPIPFSSNEKEVNTPFGKNVISIEELLRNISSKMLIAGSISPQVNELAKKHLVQIVDIMKREELAILNAISTAEGAIEIAISNTDKIIQGSNVLILGFGRIGKVLARKMQALSANVTCAVRKKEDIAWLKAYGYQVNNINTLAEELSQYDIIINTVPHLVLTKRRLEYVKPNCLLMDLASKPGGMDETRIKERGLKFIWALALPGKVAPVTSAEFIKDTIDYILEENMV